MRILVDAHSECIYDRMYIGYPRIADTLERTLSSGIIFILSRKAIVYFAEVLFSRL